MVHSVCLRKSSERRTVTGAALAARCNWEDSGWNLNLRNSDARLAGGNSRSAFCNAPNARCPDCSVSRRAAALGYIASSLSTAVGIRVPTVGPGDTAVTVRNTLASESAAPSSRVPTVSQSHGTLEDVGPGHSISSR